MKLPRTEYWTRMIIREAVRTDAEAIHALHTSSVTTLCRTHYSAEQIQRWLQGRSPQGYFEGIDAGTMFVGEIDGVIVGFGHAISGEVLAVFVDPKHGGKGIGSHLLAHAVEMARCDFSGPIKLVSTLNAEAFYSRHGFKSSKRYSVVRNKTEIPVVMMRLGK